MNPLRQNISMRQLKGETKSEPREIHHNRSFQDIGRFTNISKESESRSSLVVDPYEERKPELKHGLMEIKQAKNQINQLSVKKMKASEDAQIVEHKLRELEKQYDKVVCQGKTIEFKLENEKDGLQMMTLKGEAEYNAREQQRRLKEIKQCQRKLEKQQLLVNQMEVSQEAQMVKQKLWELRRYYRKLVNKGNAIVVKLKDEKDELQKMTLTGEAEDNAKEQQGFLKEIKQCEGNLEILQEKKEQLSAAIKQLSAAIKLQAKQMQASQEAKMVEQQLWELQKYLQKLEGQRDVIEFKLKDEKNELQKMTLKRKADYNALKQQRLIKEIQQCERNLDQLKLKAEAKMVEQKLWELRKYLQKLEGQRDVIEFKLKDEKNELKKMALKRKADYNALKQQSYLKEIKQCQRNLKKLQEKKEQLSESDKFTSQNSAPLKEKFEGFPPINPKKK